MRFPNWLYNRYLIQINYRSGIQVEQWFHQFDITYIPGAVTKVKFVEVGEDLKAVFLNVDQIESVFRLKVRLRPFGNITAK